MKLHLSSKNFVTAIGVTSALALSACTINNNSTPVTSSSPSGMMDGEMMGHQTTLSSADIMFLQMMIPHHEQAIEMSQLASSNTKNSDVLTLAAQILAAQQPEIDLMKKLLTDAGQPLISDHGMGDNGMMGANDMAELDVARDKTFDNLYLQGMIKHHSGAINMARGVTASSNTEVSTLAKNIVQSQTAEIKKMSALLSAVS